MRVRLEALGCRLNIGEMEALARALASRGHRIVGPGDAVDLVVLNTCAVTHVASRKSRKLLRKLRRRHPAAKLVVTGCYAELEPRQVADLGVDLVVPNQHKDGIPERLARAGVLTDSDPLPAPDGAPHPAVPGGRTRAFVKVQDGCENRCTFCIVTVARGDSRSRPIQKVVEEVNELADLGYREVVLSGVHLGSYGRDLERHGDLEHLVERLLELTTVARIRLSSLEPWDLRPELFDLWSDSRLQPHLHLPLQSGCDATLARMARRTTRAEFRDLVDAARARIPDLAVSTDLIVGFPGETAAQFSDSLEFVDEMAFSRLHVFRYSPRAGTAAAGMPEQVAAPEALARSGAAHALGADLEDRYRSRFLERSLEVLWEDTEPCESGIRWNGLTGNYLRVVTETDLAADLRNRTEEVTLVASLPGALYGRSESTLRTGAVPGRAVAAV